MLPLHPGGMTDISPGLRSNATIPPGLRRSKILHPGGPSGMKNDLSHVFRSGGVAIAQPPANFCYPSGIKTDFASSGRRVGRVHPIN
jgi:hypothetical protein